MTRTGWPWHAREVCPDCGRMAVDHCHTCGACGPAGECQECARRPAQGDIFTALYDWYETEGSADVPE